MRTNLDLIAKSVEQCSPKTVDSMNLKPAGVMVLLFEREGEHGARGALLLLLCVYEL